MDKLVQRTLLSALSLACMPLMAAQQQALLNQAYLWDKVEISPSLKTTKKKEGVVSTDINYQLLKTIPGYTSFLHYHAYYQGYPIYQGQVVLAKKQGQTVQGMGHLYSHFIDDLPNVSQRLVLDENQLAKIVTQRQPEGITIERLVFKPMVAVIKNRARAVYQARFIQKNADGFVVARSEWLIDGVNADVLLEKDNLNKSAEWVSGGGVGGNEKLGLTCFSSSPDSMNECRNYTNFASQATEILFQDHEAALFAGFNGYPFVVTKDNDTCTLLNEAVYTIEYQKDTESNEAFSYPCVSANNEHFNQTQVDDTYYDFFAYSPLNSAHFNAGVVMQMYHKYLNEMLPANQIYLSQIKQRTNAKGRTGGEMANANWDGQYVNYGNGDYGAMFYPHTTLDLVAHEVSHAVTEWHSGLGGENQAGSLNEAFSDIAAAAANDYFDRHLQVRPDNEMAGKSYKLSTQYTAKRDRQWWYAWDVVVDDLGGRYFHVPSLDGQSIDDARDYELGKGIHQNGGAIRKLFYLLVSEYGLSVKEAFKLFLRANATCWMPTTTFDQAGACLLLQTNDLSSDAQEAAVLYNKVDKALHSVGITAASSGISQLNFSSMRQYHSATYWINETNIQVISSISVDWGDGTEVETWAQGSGIPIYGFLTRTHQFPNTENTEYKISISAVIDGVEREGYRVYYFDNKLVDCQPKINSAATTLSGLAINQSQLPLNAQGYQYLDTPETGLNKLTSNRFDLTGAEGKKLTLYVDSNRDGVFENAEAIATNFSINSSNTSLSLPENQASGPVLLRFVITENNYSNSFSCGDVSQGQVVDVMSRIEVSTAPPEAEFSYQVLDNNRVQFTNKSTVDESRLPSYEWDFGYNNQTSTLKDPGVISYANTEQEIFNVSLNVKYNDGSNSSDSYQRQINLPRECKPRINDNANLYGFYIDELQLYQYGSNADSANVNSAGTQAGGYIAHNSAINMYKHNEINFRVLSNPMPRGTAERLIAQVQNQQDARMTVWIDKDGDKKFERSEAQYFNDNFYLKNTACENDCRIESVQVLSLASQSTRNYRWCSGPWWNKEYCQYFDARIRLEDSPQSELGQDACQGFSYGEVEDIEIRSYY